MHSLLHIHLTSVFINQSLKLLLHFVWGLANLRDDILLVCIGITSESGKDRIRGRSDDGCICDLGTLSRRHDRLGRGCGGLLGRRRVNVDSMHNCPTFEGTKCCINLFLLDLDAKLWLRKQSALRCNCSPGTAQARTMNPNFTWNAVAYETVCKRN